MKRVSSVAVVLLVLAGAGCGKTDAKTTTTATAATTQAPLPPSAPEKLHAVADFDVVTDPDDRARAIFLEATRVMFHPRCMNCHPDGPSPLQGMEQRTHDPPVERGRHDEHGDHGLPAASCTDCHQTKNQELARVPGAPKWALAPTSMIWQHRTPRQLCEQLKDPGRNGGKTLTEIVEHSAHDELVAWGWAPGHGREPAPGTQAQFGALMKAWQTLGAACPLDPPLTAALETP